MFPKGRLVKRPSNPVAIEVQKINSVMQIVDMHSIRPTVKHLINNRSVISSLVLRQDLCTSQKDAREENRRPFLGQKCNNKSIQHRNDKMFCVAFKMLAPHVNLLQSHRNPDSERRRAIFSSSRSRGSICKLFAYISCTSDAARMLSKIQSLSSGTSDSVYGTF